jgi:transposase
VQRFETPAGFQGQVDFASFNLPWGRRYALLVVLGYSRLIWLKFFARQTMQCLFSGLESAFGYFGGVPQELLFDQMRAVVIGDDRMSKGALVMNAEFLRFAAHWGFRPRACRPYRAKTKGKVERPIRYLRESFFYGRTFLNDADLNAQAERWLESTANRRKHRTISESPTVRFERDERQSLQLLAKNPYPRLLVVTQQPAAKKPSYQVEVQRRPLSVYAEAVR